MKLSPAQAEARKQEILKEILTYKVVHRVGLMRNYDYLNQGKLESMEPVGPYYREFPGSYLASAVNKYLEPFRIVPGTSELNALKNLLTILKRDFTPSKA